jgi:ribosome-associated protein
MFDLYFKTKKMKLVEFELKENDYIELNQLMKIVGWVNSGGEANTFITNGDVVVNDVVETRKRNKIRVGFKIVFNGKTVIIK